MKLIPQQRGVGLYSTVKIESS